MSRKTMPAPADAALTSVAPEPPLKTEYKVRTRSEDANFLALYFREMARLGVLRPQQEFDSARQLEGLDPRGAHVIALQSALFKGRGRRFGVLVGSPAVHYTLAATGGPDLLRSEPTDGLSSRFSIPSSHSDGADLSTTVTRDLGVGLTLQS